jgi:hypothetical protein
MPINLGRAWKRKNAMKRLHEIALGFILLSGASILTGPAIAQKAPAAHEVLSEDDLLWREKMGWNPQVHDTGTLQELDKILARAPYAYYPYSNELEVLFDYKQAIKPLSDQVFEKMPHMRRLDREDLVKTLPDHLPEQSPASITVRVLTVDSDKVILERAIALDEKGRGHGLFKMPKLAKGTYRVEYDLGGGAVIKSNRHFTRRYFEFEHNTIGEMHEVYAPFTPVEVDGNKVSVVDRTYTINAQGLFDNVISKGRELLAEPMQLVIELENGETVEWGTGLFSDGVKGKSTHPDEAVFTCESKSSRFTIHASLLIQEDGCAKITMTLAPEKSEIQNPKSKIKRAYLRMALKESEAPLCHMIGMNSMRHNYAGKVPRGGKINWIMQSWRPARFEVEAFDGPAPEQYEVWDGRQQMHWGREFWNFNPYVWLGAEERGLAWFGDHTAGYETDGERGIQRLRIEPGKVVLHVELIQTPVALDAPRTFTFGLQASPTKPMMEDWRGYDVPGGGGMSVVVWGGYNCASHYPDPKDWRIVEKVVSARDPEVNKNVWQGDFKAFFEEMNKQREFPELKIHGHEEWLANVLGFASRSRGSPNGITVYYEEFQTSGLHPESYEYMDEWDLGSWCRFTMYNYEAKPFTDSRGWGPAARTANQASWRDFAVYYANEWMKRGVGIYYDNTMPHTDRNRFNLRGQGVDWQSSIWGHRDYFRRVWKQSRYLMANGLTPVDPYDPKNPRKMRLHIVGHVTNTQLLPYTTWWDATLGIEAPGQWIPENINESKIYDQKRDFTWVPGPSTNSPGEALPYPPDYLRAMEMGRMAGLISHSRHLLRSEDAFGGLGISYGSATKPSEEVIYHRTISDRAMNLVHEIRGGGGNPYEHDHIRTLLAAFSDFGYGKPDVTVHNYWAEDPFLKVSNEKIKWIALERFQVSGVSVQEKKSGAAVASDPETRNLTPDTVLALLQSYDAKACETRIDLPKGTVLLDLFTRRLQPGNQPVEFVADYGTRLFLIGSRDALAPLAWADDMLLRGDFEFGLPPFWSSRGEVAPKIVADPAKPGNHVLRVTPGHPSQNHVSGKTEGDYELSFRFRLPALTNNPPYAGFYGFLQVLHRQVGSWPKQNGQTLALGIQNNAKGEAALAATYATRREGTVEAFANVTTDRLKETGALVPLDTAWHILTLTVQGNRQTLSIDGIELFSGETDVTGGGALVLGPGWSGWAGGLPYADVDELVVRAIKK